MPKVNSPKKHRLTLAQLSAYDDILTDALVDHVYFWTEIRKNKNAYHPARNITEEAVTSVLQKRVIVENDPATAEKELLALEGLKRFSNNLKTEPEKRDFQQHLRRYVNIYLNDCPWEVSTTNRYTLVTQEAAVTARRDIKKGEVVKYLCGVQVQLTEEEEELIKSKAKDFSIVVSSRSKTASLFLGPARFANHDCNANARLKTTGPNGMEIVAYQKISEGEEVTVSYGENYFGEDNCECLCRTCETLCRNGWTRPEGDVDDKTIVPKQSIEPVHESAGDYSRRLRQQIRRDSASSRSPSMTPEINIRPHVSKRTPRSLRFKVANSPLGKSRSLDTDALLDEDISPTKQTSESRELERLLLTPSKKAAKTCLSTELIDGETTTPTTLPLEPETTVVASQTCSPSLSPSPSSGENQNTTAATSIDGDATVAIEHGVISAPTFKSAGVQDETVELLAQADAGESILVGASTSVEHPAVVSEKDAQPVEPEQADEQPSTKPSEGSGDRKRKRRKVQPRSDKDHAPAVRYPGDYVLTPALLAEPAMSWIVCKNCEEAFVQSNAYFTRSSCPRCERHSKLYGYCWPKTTKEDSEDEEERVLDHRTIHRFIRPEEEKKSRKLARQTSAMTLSIDNGDESEAAKLTPCTSPVRKQTGKRKSLADNGENIPEVSGERRSSRKRAKRTSSFD